MKKKTKALDYFVERITSGKATVGDIFSYLILVGISNPEQYLRFERSNK